MTPQLHHVLDGPDDAPVLVLGPSLGTDTGLFDAQVAAFAGRFRVLRWDLPGHGRSPDPTGPVTVADLADGVVELLDRLGIDRCHYAGVSLGGAVGQQLAIAHPDRLTGLAVLASAARFGDPEPWRQRAATVRAHGTEAMVGSRTGTWFTAGFAEANPGEAQRLLGMLQATSADGYAACCEAIAAFDVRSRLGEIRVPTLAVAGEVDPATPPAALEEIADGVPGATLVLVPGAAHLVNVEAPDVVDDALARHLDAA